MAFLFDTAEEHASFEEQREQWRKYQAYLESIKEKLPSSAFEFATAPWHYDYSDPRCPHDACLETMVMREGYSRGKSSSRVLDIELKLLGAYANGYLNLRYKNVQRYSLGHDVDTFKEQNVRISGHSDWLIDEIRLSDNGFVVHDIQFWVARWRIECEDIEAEWKPRGPITVKLVAYRGSFYLPLGYFGNGVHTASFDLDGLTALLEKAVLGGNVGEYALVQVYKDVPHAAGVSSWQRLAKGGALYILKFRHEITLEMSQRERKERFAPDPHMERHFSLDTNLRTIAQAILDDVQARPEVCFPPEQPQPPKPPAAWLALLTAARRSASYIDKDAVLTSVNARPAHFGERHWRYDDPHHIEFRYERLDGNLVITSMQDNEPRTSRKSVCVAVEDAVPLSVERQKTMRRALASVKVGPREAGMITLRGEHGGLAFARLQRFAVWPVISLDLTHEVAVWRVHYKNSAHDPSRELVFTVNAQTGEILKCRVGS